MKNRKFVFISILLIAFLFVFNNMNLIKIFSLPNDFYVGFKEVEISNKNNEFGKFVDISLKEKDIDVSSNKKQEAEMIFKLFGIVPIKKVNVRILPQEEVYVGGCPLGFSMGVDGAVVVSNSVVVPESSEIIKNNNFGAGDIIKQINGREVHCVNDVLSALDNCSDGEAVITLQTHNREEEKMMPLLKDADGNYRLGLWVRDEFSGIGTLTFVGKEGDDYKFAALGHPITNGKNNNIMPVRDGKIFSCSLVDILKGERNRPGELRCVYIDKNKVGDFNKNTKVGVFGGVDDISELVDQNRTMLLGGRLSVKPGHAKIISKVSGMLEEYDIEIIKTAYQSSMSDKSLVFRVADKRLLDLTGGIVQGMSGSPIVQDGKIVGAVTHVFVSDPTKGYGVYSDWMLEQISEINEF